jgi:hypothetical protein
MLNTAVNTMLHHCVPPYLNTTLPTHLPKPSLVNTNKLANTTHQDTACRLIAQKSSHSMYACSSALARALTRC